MHRIGTLINTYEMSSIIFYGPMVPLLGLSTSLPPHPFIICTPITPLGL